MSISEAKAQLLVGMDMRRQKNRELVESVNPERVVHPDSGWRVKDLIGHLTFWEEETLKSLHAFLQNTSYELPLFLQDEQVGFTNKEVDAFNQADYEQRIDYTAERILTDWEAVREQLKDAVRAVPDDQFENGTFDALWGRDITVTQLVKGMGWHEKIHMQDIQTAIDKTE